MDEITIDLKDIIKTIRKQFRLILKIFLGFVIVALAVSFLVPPTFEAETTLRIKQPKGLASSLLAELPLGGFADIKLLTLTYAEILKSRTVVQVVIDQTQADKEDIPDYEDMLDRISTNSVKDTDILKVRVTAKSAEEAQLVANTLVDTFLNRITYLERMEQAMIREFIGTRLAEAKTVLEKNESMLEEYKRSHKIFAPDAETRALLDRLYAVSKLQADNTVILAASQAKLNNAQQNLSQQKAGFIADSPLIQQYKAKLANLEVDLVGLLEKYTEKHPQVIAAKAAIAETKTKLNTEIVRVVNAESPSANPIHQLLLQSKIQAEVEIAVTLAQNTAIERVLADSEKDLDKLPVKEQGLARVVRDTMVAQEIYIMLAKRHEEARISEVMKPTDVQVIDVAIAPEEPIKPNKILNVLIGAILGVFTGLGVAFFLEYMDKSIRNAEDIKYYLGLAVLGNIPGFEDTIDVPKASFWVRLKQLIKKPGIPG